MTTTMTTTPTRCSPAGATRRPTSSPSRNLEHGLHALDTGDYGMILRAKGIVDGGADGWLSSTMFPASWKIRTGGCRCRRQALVVIGSKLNEHAIAELFAVPPELKKEKP